MCKKKDCQENHDVSIVCRWNEKCTNKACRFAHKDKAAHNTKPVECKWEKMEKGKCKFGGNCRYIYNIRSRQDNNKRSDEPNNKNKNINTKNMIEEALNVRMEEIQHMIAENFREANKPEDNMNDTTQEL